jgi:hypothetical protein
MATTILNHFDDYAVFRQTDASVPTPAGEQAISETGIQFLPIQPARGANPYLKEKYSLATVRLPSCYSRLFPAPEES